MAKTGRKRNSPEGTRNQMSFVVEDEIAEENPQRIEWEYKGDDRSP